MSPQGGSAGKGTALRNNSDADVVLFLYRDDYYNKETEDPNTAECIIAKNRHGATGTVKLHWLGQYTTFSSRDTVHGAG